MKKLIYILMAAVTLACCCPKAADFDLTLGLNNTHIDLSSASEGWCVIPIYSNTSWKASLDEGCTWASLSVTEGRGYGETVFSYSDNGTGAERTVIFTVTASGEEKTISITQPS